MSADLVPFPGGDDPAIITPALEQREAVIERGMKTFMDVGHALLDIREGRLYRYEYRDFETYCQTRWGFSRQRASQIIQAAEVSKILDSGGGPVPMIESQARALHGMEPETAREVWQTVNEETGGKPTAAALTELRRAYEAPPAESDEDDDVVDAEVIDDPPDRTPRKPPRKALVEVAKTRGFALRAATDSLMRLFDDDRYRTNEKQVADVLRGHLLYVAETVTAVIDQLP